MNVVTKEHQKFIEDTTQLSKNAKDQLITAFVENFDLMAILEDPEVANELLAAFFSDFEEYYREAILLGNDFGNVKKDQFLKKANV